MKEQASSATRSAASAVTAAKLSLAANLDRRRSVSDLKNCGVIQAPSSEAADLHDATGGGVAQLAADKAARRRNAAVELTRMLDVRPAELPDGKGSSLKKQSAAVSAALASPTRPTEADLVARNVVKEIDEQTGLAPQEMARIASVGALSELHGRIEGEKEEKEAEEKEEEKKVKKAARRKKKVEAVIPVRIWKAPMQNTASWKHVDKYAGFSAVSFRGTHLAQMDAERRRAHILSEKAAETSTDKYYGKYGRREVSAVRYASRGVGADRRKSEYGRNFAWPGFTPR